jgi:hypothetical protein
MLPEPSLSAPPSIARNLLEDLYPRVDTLLAYLCLVVPEFSLTDQDASAPLEELHSLLASTLVGYDELEGKRVFVPVLPEMEQEEVGSRLLPILLTSFHRLQVIDHAQLTVFKEARGRINNVLCFGYRQVSVWSSFRYINSVSLGRAKK